MDFLLTKQFSVVFLLSIIFSMQGRFIKIAKVALILVYLVIVAGAVVRMTGSGMGCPDWPKCFGYYIPPTEESQLKWQADHPYKRGQVIIHEEALYVARTDFVSTDKRNQANWAPYTKHDYAVFNASHTWIEFINRLFGALAGLATLALAIVSIRFWKGDKKITLISWFIVFCMGFQAWLGATVVYSLLEPVKITVHMIMALLIVALLIFVIDYGSKEKDKTVLNKSDKYLIWTALGLTLIQIVLGTQVRQFIDHQSELLGLDAKELFLEDPVWSFYVHRSFSIIILLVNAALAFSLFRKKWAIPQISWILSLLLLEVFTGILMNYFDFPFGSQPLHLVIASLLFGIQFHLLLVSRDSKKTGISL